MTSEEYRHQCEVRCVLHWFATEPKKGHAYLDALRRGKRGEAMIKRIEDDLRDQWKKGNRGEKDSWL